MLPYKNQALLHCNILYRKTHNWRLKACFTYFSKSIFFNSVVLSLYIYENYIRAAIHSTHTHTHTHTQYTVHNTQIPVAIQQVYTHLLFIYTGLHLPPPPSPMQGCHRLGGGGNKPMELHLPPPTSSSYGGGGRNGWAFNGGITQVEYV